VYARALQIADYRLTTFAVFAVVFNSVTVSRSFLSVYFPAYSASWITEPLIWLAFVKFRGGGIGRPTLWTGKELINFGRSVRVKVTVKNLRLRYVRVVR